MLNYSKLETLREQLTSKHVDLNNPQAIMDCVQIINSSKENIRAKPKDTNNWITPNTIRYIQTHDTRKRFGPNSLEYEFAKCQSKKLCKMDKENYINHIHNQISTLPSTNQYRKVQLTHQQNRKSWSIKADNRQILTQKNKL